MTNHPTVPPMPRFTAQPSDNGSRPVDSLIPSDPTPNHEASRDNTNDNRIPPTKKVPTPPLGKNRPSKRARKLEPADRDKIANYYIQMAVPLSFVAPKVSTVLIKNADDCADAWMLLAEENDSVRRALLAMLEGSAWAGILAAHLPIMIAALPARIVDNNPILKPIQDMVIGEEDDGEE